MLQQFLFQGWAVVCDLRCQQAAEQQLLQLDKFDKSSEASVTQAQDCTKLSQNMPGRRQEMRLCAEVAVVVHFGSYTFKLHSL